MYMLSHEIVNDCGLRNIIIMHCSFVKFIGLATGHCACVMHTQ